MKIGFQFRDNERYINSVPELVKFANLHPLTDEGIELLRIAGFVTSLHQDARLGVEYLRIAVQWSVEIGSHDAHILCLRTLAYASYLEGDLRTAEKEYFKTLRLIDSLGALLYQSYVDTALADCLLEHGKLTEAQFHITRSSEVTVHWDLDYDIVNWVLKCTHAWMSGDMRDAAKFAQTSMDVSAPDSWLYHCSAALGGLAALELGELSRAFQLADYLEGALFKRFPGDVSFVYLLIARTAVLRHREHEVVHLIRNALVEFENRDFVCRLRLQLALAETLARSASDEALALCDRTHQDASEKEVGSIIELARVTRRRIQRRRQ